MAEAKRIIGQGLLAVADTADRSVLGALTDEENGAAAARDAKANGLTLAMAAEKSSQPEFDFEYGERFGEHIEAFDPDFVKVLVRYNPEGDAEMNRRQAARLAELSDWLAPRDTKYLFELIVPLEPGQRRGSSPSRRASPPSCARSSSSRPSRSSTPPASSPTCGRSRA